MSNDDRPSTPIPPGTPISFTNSELGLGPNGTPLSTPSVTPPSSPEPVTPDNRDRRNPVIRRPSTPGAIRGR
jgi:hypothetical protein